MTVSPPISEYYINDLNVSVDKVHTIFNGIETRYLSSIKKTVSSSDKKRIVYCGKLDKSEKGRFDVCFGLIEAYKLLNEEQKNSIEIVFYGDFYDYEINILSEFFTVHKRISRELVMEVQREADVLLLLACEKYSVITGKLFEYLSTGNRILGLFDKPYAGTIINELQAGDIIPSSHTEALRIYLATLSDIDAVNYTGRLEPYMYSNLFKNYEKLI